MRRLALTIIGIALFIATTGATYRAAGPTEKPNHAYQVTIGFACDWHAYETMARTESLFVMARRYGCEYLINPGGDFFGLPHHGDLGHAMADSFRKVVNTTLSPVIVIGGPAGNHDMTTDAPGPFTTAADSAYPLWAYRELFPAANKYGNWYQDCGPVRCVYFTNEVNKAAEPCSTKGRWFNQFTGRASSESTEFRLYWPSDLFPQWSVEGSESRTQIEAMIRGTPPGHWCIVCGSHPINPNIQGAHSGGDWTWGQYAETTAPGDTANFMDMLSQLGVLNYMGGHVHEYENHYPSRNDTASATGKPASGYVRTIYGPCVTQPHTPATGPFSADSGMAYPDTSSTLAGYMKVSELAAYDSCRATSGGVTLRPYFLIARATLTRITWLRVDVAGTVYDSWVDER